LRGKKREQRGIADLKERASLKKGSWEKNGGGGKKKNKSWRERSEGWGENGGINCKGVLPQQTVGRKHRGVTREKVRESGEEGEKPDLGLQLKSEILTVRIRGMR